MAVGYPVGFVYAFGKLEEAIEELVGAGDIKRRLDTATKTLAPIFPNDFPDPLRGEYASIREAFTWLPPDQGSGQGLAESTLDAMTDEEADNQAKKLFSRYTRAAEAFHRH